MKSILFRRRGIMSIFMTMLLSLLLGLAFLTPIQYVTADETNERQITGTIVTAEGASVNSNSVDGTTGTAYQGEIVYTLTGDSAINFTFSTLKDEWKGSEFALNFTYTICGLDDTPIFDIVYKGDGEYSTQSYVKYNEQIRSHSYKIREGAAPDSEGWYFYNEIPSYCQGWAAPSMFGISSGESKDTGTLSIKFVGDVVQIWTSYYVVNNWSGFYSLRPTSTTLEECLIAEFDGTDVGFDQTARMEKGMSDKGWGLPKIYDQLKDGYKIKFGTTNVANDETAYDIDVTFNSLDATIKADMGELYTQGALCEGASIRLVEDGKSGIRFHVRVPAESYLGQNINSLQTGMLVIPTDKLGGVELTHAKTRDNYTPLGAKAADESTSGKWRETVDNGVSYMESLVYVYNIPEDSYDRGFTFRGYLKYNENYYYTAIPESRSITYVAMKANHEYNTQGSSGEITYSPSQLTVLEQYSPSRTAISSNLKNVGKYYYRVGNENVVPLDKLFALTDEYLDIAPINLSVKIETLQGTATGSYADGNFQFSNTGFVRISVLDTYSRKSSILIVEVVNGMNVTSSSISTGSTGKNVVLLNDVKIATGGYVVYNNCSVYGNGFTFSVEGGVSKFAAGTCNWGIITLTANAKLDNLVIIGDTYTKFGTYTSDSYNVAAVYSQGGTIQNCYIQGCASPVLVEGATTIKSTTLYGGAVANLQLKSGATTLNDVTTVNYNDGRKVIGLGVAFRNDALASTSLTINGTLKQYNFVASTDADNSGASTLQQIYSLIFDNQCSGYHFSEEDGKTYANTGIVSMSENITTPTITDNTSSGYQGKSVSKPVWFTTVKGYVYTQPKSVGEVDNNYVKETDEHIASVQGDQNLSVQLGSVVTPTSING